MGIEYRKIRESEHKQYFNFLLEAHLNGRLVVQVNKWLKKVKNVNLIPKGYAAWYKNDIIGTINTVPVDLRYNNSQIIGAWQQDSLVLTSFRGKGVGKKLVSIASSEYDLTIAKGTSLPMYNLRKSIGFKDVPNSNYLIKVLKPFTSNNGLKRNIAFLFLYIFSKLRCKNRKSKLKFNAIEFFNHDFDSLSKNPCDINAIEVVKGSSHLNWRYIANPIKEYHCFRADDSNGLRGAIVIGSSKANSNSAWLVDIICNTKDKECTSFLIQSASDWCAFNGKSTLHSFSTSEEFRASLFCNGFIGMKTTPRFTYRTDKTITDLEYDSAGWNFFHGDGDIELYM